MHGERHGYPEVAPEPIFTISPEARENLRKYLQVCQDPDMRRHDLIVGLGQADKELFFAMEYLMDEWGCAEQLKDSFSEGAAVAHKLLSCQAKQDGISKLPSIHPMTVYGYRYRLSESWDTVEEFFYEDFIFIGKRFGHFKDALEEYVGYPGKAWDEKEIGAFLLGAVSMFELLHEEVAPSRIVEQGEKEATDRRVQVSRTALGNALEAMRTNSHQQTIANLLREYGG